jgi:glycosyltransferase involved in cell wall biosynthesis
LRVVTRSIPSGDSLVARTGAARVRAGRTTSTGGAAIAGDDTTVENDVVIVLTYYSPYVSGLTNVARDVAEGLAARGWRVCVVASKHDPSLPTHDEIRGVRVVRAPVLAKVGKGTVGINLTRMALREMRRSRVANLHLPLIEASLLTQLSPVPVVSTYHCDVSLPPGMVNLAQREAVDRASRGGLRRSVATVVTSEDYARRSRLWPVIAPNMVAIPPPCVPVAAGAPSYRRGAGFHVGFLGRIVEEKGVEYLVDAFRALDDPDARLLIGGEHSAVAGGSVVDRVRAHADGDERIELLGFVPDDRLGDFYASVDAFALPSVNAFEAFGIVQVVGMLAGVPALASDLPGVRTPVERTGFGVVVPPRDVAALTEGLARLRDTPPDPRAGAAAAAEAFSVDAVLDAYEAVFAKAAG